METATTTSKFGKATLWSKRDGQWVAFMHLPVKHAAEVAQAWRLQRLEARVTF